MDSVKIDCRSMFRLHALDLWEVPQPHYAGHWMLHREYGCRNWLALLARDYGRLRRAGADPFSGRPITGLAVIGQLGLQSREEPHGVRGHVAFVGAMLVAASRESIRRERELMWLENHSRSKA